MPKINREFLCFVHWLHEKDPMEWRDLGIGKKIHDWRKKLETAETYEVQANSLAEICNKLGCWPDRLPLPVDSQDAVRLHLAKSDWSPPSPPLLDKLLGPLITSPATVPEPTAEGANHRLRWQLKSPVEVNFCFAMSGRVSTGVYQRRVTGRGQVAALRWLLRSLTEGYGAYSIDFLFADETPTKVTRGNLVLLGSSKTNTHTKLFLECLNERLKEGYCAKNPDGKVLSHLDTFVKPEDVLGQAQRVDICRIHRTVDKVQLEPLESVVIDGVVKKDYGVVIRCPNPHAPSKMAYLFAGVHTYGTEGAADMFVNRFRPSESSTREEVIILIIECDVINDEPANVRELERYTFNMPQGWW